MTQSAYNSSPGHNRVSDLLPYPNQDIANKILGDLWRMPSEEDFQELIDNCDWIWSQYYGKPGYWVRSRSNSNAIFIPVAGDINNGSLQNVGVKGYYWCSDYVNTIDCSALIIDENSHEIGNMHRFQGLTIRPVYDY